MKKTKTRFEVKKVRVERRNKRVLPMSKVLRLKAIGAVK